MAFYEASSITTIVTATANTPICSLRAITRSCRLVELGISAITAPTTSGGLGLVRSTALGTGTLTGVLGQPRDPSDTAGTGELITAWATLAPTVGTSYMRRFAFPASIGAAVIWTWPEERSIQIPGSASATSELVITNLQGTAPGTFEVYAVWIE